MKCSRILPLFLAIGSLLGVGCAAPQSPPVAAAGAGPAPIASACDEARDRTAIRAMAGSYDVVFTFEETEPLSAGYAARPLSRSDATEFVAVLEDVPGRVSLQHVLVVGAGKDAHVIKHWRQDWSFQDRQILEFLGKRSFKQRQLTEAEATCSWTQAVFEVDDAPRYEGFGRWEHAASGSVWQSNETWRPLPRREYTKRSDYDVLVGTNRHRITATGWEHEQDNIKLVLEPRHSLVKERGLNRYTRVDAAATQPASDYWVKSAGFWKQVREEWARVLTTHPQLTLRSEVDGKRLYELLFSRLDDAAAARADTPTYVRDSIGKYLLVAPSSP